MAFDSDLADSDGDFEAFGARDRSAVETPFHEHEYEHECERRLPSLPDVVAGVPVRGIELQSSRIDDGGPGGRGGYPERPERGGNPVNDRSVRIDTPRTDSPSAERTPGPASRR